MEVRMEISLFSGENPYGWATRTYRYFQIEGVNQEESVQQVEEATDGYPSNCKKAPNKNTRTIQDMFDQETGEDKAEAALSQKGRRRGQTRETNGEWPMGQSVENGRKNSSSGWLHKQAGVGWEEQVTAVENVIVMLSPPEPPYLGAQMVANVMLELQARM
ncbi:unnamed protein product [Sphenostylis stenocarpa]|uniref:Uncharacterized protein n=1 Tax=Sphenostylis stenocarpa TaxID=92480 RepID=A0AA86VHA0_9FABA|nr:unnamed protein product [Sphenostylis stenocarpa]